MNKIQTKKVVKQHKDLDIVKDSAISFEEASNELEEIALKLEKESISLTDTVKLCARGRFLHDLCIKKLLEAQMVVNDIVVRDGNDCLQISKSNLEELY